MFSFRGTLTQNNRRTDAEMNMPKHNEAAFITHYDESKILDDGRIEIKNAKILWGSFEIEVPIMTMLSAGVSPYIGKSTDGGGEAGR